MAGRIFINYRKRDTKGYSQLVFNYLENLFGTEEIFMDVDDIDPGRDYHKVLEDALDGCDVMLSMIGPDWLHIKGNDGSRKLDNPDDWVRWEIRSANKNGVTIIPVLVDGADFLSASDLPDDLKFMANLHAHTIGDYFNADMKRLLPSIMSGLLEANARSIKKIDDQEDSAQQKEAEIKNLLRQAQQALDAEIWARAQLKARAVLILDPDNIKAQVIDASAEAAEQLAQEAAEEEDRRQADLRKAAGKTDKKPPAVEKALSEAQENDQAETASVPPAPKTAFSMPTWGWGVIGLAAVGLIFGVIQMSGGSLFSSATPTETALLTLTPTEPDPTATLEPTKTVEPTVTGTLMPTLTPTLTPAPTLGVGSLSENLSDQASMAYIPAGEFEMGSDGGIRAEQPISPVNLDAFWIYQTEVTNGQYELCVAAGKCVPPSGSFYGISSYNSHPVVNVDFEQAQSYCDWAGGRLPTEAEWEKAARGGVRGSEYPWGNQQPICEQGAKNGAQFSSCSPFSTVPVASFGSNGYELFDTAGNAWEWTNTCYEDYPYNPADGRDVVDRNCRVVLRGGSRGSAASSLRVALRNPIPQQQSDDLTGFRCVVDPE